MKKYLKLALLTFIIGMVAMVGLLIIIDPSTPTFDFTEQEYTSRVESALQEMKDDKLSFSNVENAEKDGVKTRAIAIYDNGPIGLYIESINGVNKVTFASNYFTMISLGEKSFSNAIRLFVGTVDDTLSFGERELLRQEIFRDYTSEKEVLNTVTKNGIKYTLVSNPKQMRLKIDATPIKGQYKEQP